MSPSVIRSSRLLARVRRVSVLAVTAALAAGVVACSPAERSEGTLIVSVYPGAFADQFETHIAEPFRQAHPEVDLQLVESGGSAADLAALRTSSGGVPFDVGIMDLLYADVARRDGLFENLDPAAVPNLASVDEERRLPDDAGAPFTYDTLVISRDTEAVPEAPDSWNTLWDPAYAGRVVVNESQLPFFLPIVASLVGDDYEQSIDRSVARLAELAPSVMTWTAQPDPYTLILNGDGDLALGYNARSQFYADQDPQGYAVTMPREGSVVQINTINMVAGTPNSELAQRFIDHAISAEAQAEFARAMYYGPVNDEVELPAEIEQRTALGLLAQADQTIVLDYEFLADNIEAWNSIFRRDVVRNG